MSTKVEEGKSYDGYENLSAIEWCTPTFLNCQVCVSAKAVKGKLTITLHVKTPFGNASKDFAISGNVNFTWQPISRFKIAVTITDLNENHGAVSFNLGLNPCLDVPIVGWKCYNFRAQINVPASVQGFESELDNSQLTGLLALNTGDSGAGMLQGDIYNNYLGSNAGAGFPTIPVMSCVTCTNIPLVCDSANASATGNVGAPFPTNPPQTCIICTGVPSCSTLQGANAGNAAAGFPTIPVMSCVTCTNIPLVCNSANAAGNAGAGFPTNPPQTCIICTGVPSCSTLQGANTGNAAATPTFVLAQCLPTLLPPCPPPNTIAGQCIPTIANICRPTMMPRLCPQTVIAACGVQSNDAGVGAGIPTIPVIQCVPTGQCVPTIQCIPTVQCIPTIVQCTGIPFIC